MNSVAMVVRVVLGLSLAVVAPLHGQDPTVGVDPQPSVDLPEDMARVLRDAIRQAYEIAGGPLRLRAIEYGSDGDVGYIVGAYGYGEDLPAEDRGLFVLTLGRDPSGRWLIVSDLDRGAG